MMIGKPSQSSFNSGLKSQKFQHLVSSLLISSFHSSILHAKLPNPFNKAACQQSLDCQKGASRARAVACCSGSLVWCRNTACTCSHYPWTSPPGWSVQAGCPPKQHADMLICQYAAARGANRKSQWDKKMICNDMQRRIPYPYPEWFCWSPEPVFYNNLQLSMVYGPKCSPSLSTSPACCLHAMHRHGSTAGATASLMSRRPASGCGTGLWLCDHTNC